MHSTKGSSHPESMSSHKRRKQEIRQETLKTNYSNDSSKNILPGNKDDSASETTGEHINCQPISNSFRESTNPQVEFRIKKSKDQQTDGQPGLVTLETGGQETQDFINVIFVSY